MRKIIFSACFALWTLFSYGQETTHELWKCSSLEECAALAHSLLSVSKRTYVPDVRVSFPELHKAYVVYRFVEKDHSQAAPRRVTMLFNLRMEGENKSLEIEGTPVYSLDVIEGAYLDLFPIWKTWVKPDADPESVAAEKKDRINIGPEETFVRYWFEDTGSDGIWTLNR